MAPTRLRLYDLTERPSSMKSSVWSSQNQAKNINLVVFYLASAKVIRRREIRIRDIMIVNKLQIVSCSQTLRLQTPSKIHLYFILIKKIYLAKLYISNRQSYWLLEHYLLYFKKKTPEMLKRESVQNRQLSAQLTPRTNNEQKNKDKVKVILRIRPFLITEEQEEFISVQNQTTVLLNKPGYPTYMKFNHVQSEDITKKQEGQTQQNIFSHVKQAVQCIFKGIDSTIFAYGQTGAGKTYTIVGNCPQINSQSQNYKQSLLKIDRGILPRALQMIFNQQNKKKDSRITISFYEIYNEKIFDLLTSNIKPLDIREAKAGQLSILGLSFIQVINMKEVLNYLAQGIKNRVTSSTSANIKSSRSHSIFHIKYEKLYMNHETGEHDVLIANLRVVDLAGSQKFNIPSDLSGSEKQIKLLQLKSINGSLSKLGHCISALTVQSRTHIPFRDSKLTRILSDALMGSGKIRLIICVSPSSSAMNQTSSTLQFADRVKKASFQKVQVSVQKKRTVDYEELKALQEELQIQRNRRIQCQYLLKQWGNSRNLGQAELIRQNHRLKQELLMARQELKIYANMMKIRKNDESINNSRLNTRRDKQKYPNILNSDKKNASPIRYNGARLIKKQTPNNYHNESITSINNSNNAMNAGLKKQSNILASKSRTKTKAVTSKLIHTPPKTSATRSVHQFQSKQRHSLDISPHRSKHQININGQKKNGQKQHFQSKLKNFMQKADIDRNLQQKVRQRLQQIKRELTSDPVQYPWKDNQTEGLWKYSKRQI